MQTKTILYTVIAILIIAGIAFIGLNHKGNQARLNQATLNQTGSNQANQSPKLLFSSSPYAPYSYLVSGDNLSQQAQSALAGFNLSSSNLKNGSRLITVSVVGTSINKTFALASGDKLYIIETSFGDDGFHFDSSLGDDGFIITDPNGYIVA